MLLDVDRYLSEHSLSARDFQEMLNARPRWFHCFNFTNGCTTPGYDPSSTKLTALALPGLQGKSVIDVGAYDGYFSFHAERLGAARVVAADSFVWTLPGTGALGNFELIHETLRSNVERVTVSVEALNPDQIGCFDVTLFLGVLYHAPNMIEYLQRVRAITRETLILETLVDLLHVPEPAAAYYPSGSLNGDSSNWWGPNTDCVTDMLKRVGFRSVEFKELWDKNTVAAIRGTTPGRLESGRAVFHAHV
jgi:tRNA (mo5U34)-methyltransferase